jgi:hypothetical protein
MLIYHPAFDAYHCSFQLLCIAERLRQCEVQKARVLDFCLSFPTALLEFHLPQDLGVARSVARSQANPYRDPKSHKILFQQLQPMQQAAMQCLAAAGILDVTDLERGVMTRTDVPLSSELLARIARHVESDSGVANVVLGQIARIPLLGPGGLKDRSGLLDHRYDVVETHAANS